MMLAKRFDLEDYAVVYRETRDAYIIKAANKLKLATHSSPRKAVRDAHVTATVTHTKSINE